MKKYILFICFIFCLFGVISCSLTHARNNEVNNKMETVIKDNGLYVYKFTVKDYGGINHEIIVCSTSSDAGGVSMLEICKYR